MRFSRADEVEEVVLGIENRHVLRKRLGTVPCKSERVRDEWLIFFEAHEGWTRSEEVTRTSLLSNATSYFCPLSA